MPRGNTQIVIHMCGRQQRPHPTRGGLPRPQPLCYNVKVKLVVRTHVVLRIRPLVLLPHEARQDEAEDDRAGHDNVLPHKINYRRNEEQR